MKVKFTMFQTVDEAIVFIMKSDDPVETLLRIIRVSIGNSEFGFVADLVRAYEYAEAKNKKVANFQ